MSVLYVSMISEGERREEREKGQRERERESCVIPVIADLDQ